MGRSGLVSVQFDHDRPGAVSSQVPEQGQPDLRVVVQPELTIVRRAPAHAASGSRWPALAARTALAGLLLAGATLAVLTAVTGNASVAAPQAQAAAAPHDVQLLGSVRRPDGLRLLVAPPGGGPATEVELAPYAWLTVGGSAATPEDLATALRSAAPLPLRVWYDADGRIVRADLR